ncbi:hypothetical protein F5148DRAFT_327053 [Russula earlei]|uniref:Uncharacterized protein n=1 Tax=Russula earlei TaxID=71964 RepID=A0ACC0UK68_9AGAM|nr:hypothetical protein F5148DRAFT_327053 [Russula earlei]
MSLSCEYVNFGSPFDDSDADLILRSSPVPVPELVGENRAIATQFRVYKLILIKSSLIFKRLLSETSESHLDNQLGITRDNSDNLPVLCLPEDRDTLHSLLTAIYPTDVVHPQTLDALLRACAAARKYNMSSTLALFRPYGIRAAPILTTQNAFRAYALAFNEGLKDEALEAALWTLSLPQTIETYGEDLSIASGPALYTLWRHRENVLFAIEIGIQECTADVGDLRGWLSSSHGTHDSCPDLGSGLRNQFINSIKKLTADFSSMSFPKLIETMPSQGRFQCKSCGDHLQLDLLRLFNRLERRLRAQVEQVHLELLPLFDGSEEHAPAPQSSSEQSNNFGAPFDRQDADLIIRSFDHVDFHVHKAILGTASVVFEDMFTAPGPSPGEQGQHIPVINLAEDSKTLYCLLTAIYPIDCSIPETLEDVLSLLIACQKYQMDSTLTCIRSLLKGRTPPLFTAPNSFHAYGIASRYNLKEEVHLAAQATLERPLSFDECGEDLRFISGADLMRLWRYRGQCTKVAKNCISQMKVKEDIIRRHEARSGFLYDAGRPFVTGWCYDHFLIRAAVESSSKLITDRQALEIALKKYRKSHDTVYSPTNETRICESIRAEAEEILRAAIDAVDVELSRSS